MGRMEKKLKDWKSRVSSNAEKLTLVKSMAQAILMYVMSCFKISNSVIG